MKIELGEYTYIFDEKTGIQEVFVVAHQNLSEESTFNQCSAEIGHQMDEWEL